MEKFAVMATRSAACVLLSILATSFALQDNPPVLTKGYYITVGAFAPSKLSYAKAFRDKLSKEGYHPEIGLDVKRNLLLIYLDRYEEYQPSIDEMLQTRKRGAFPEAWVRIIRQGEYEEAQPTTANEQRNDSPLKQEPVSTPVVTSPVTTTPATQVDSSTVKSQPVIVEIPEPKEDKKQPAKKGPATLQNTKVILHLFDANNSRPIDGSVEVVDAQRARLITTFKAGDTVMLPNPNNDTKMLILVGDVFGYRKVQHKLNFAQPIADTSKYYFDLFDDYYVARFEMVRYHRGDIATLYHVYFFNDAAIMQPDSKYELNKLLDMMKSNPGYRIRLHGHTNGNAHGKIISMGPSKDFFSVNAPDVKTGSGSSKALSGERAEVIKEWLIAQGIAADRMEVKAWGGKRMLHDRNSQHARKNVRVEVEVLEE